MKALYKVVLLTGLLAGTLDIISAILVAYLTSGRVPYKIFHYISSGVLGKEKAYAGGFEMVILGLFLHFLIAYIFTVFYFWIYPKVGFLSINKVVSAILYGAFMWVVMNKVVLPLSRVPQGKFDWTQAIIGLTVLIVMLGLPIAFNAHKYYKSDEAITTLR